METLSMGIRIGGPEGKRTVSVLVTRESGKGTEGLLVSVTDSENGSSAVILSDLVEVKSKLHTIICEVVR